MKTKNSVGKKQYAPGGSLERVVGRSYILMREGHDWHGCAVDVLINNGGKCRVTLATEAWRELVAQEQKKHGKVYPLVTVDCTEDELW